MVRIIGTKKGANGRVIKIGRTHSKKPRGLSNTAKSQVAKIAKAQVKNVAEKKFFNVNQIDLTQPVKPALNNRVSGIGYSTTEDSNEAGAVVQWCGATVKEMLCLRPWAANTAGATTKQKALAMEGKHLQPVSCKSRFRISRQFAEIDPSALQTPAEFPVKLAENCPVICRVMRVTPKVAAGTTTEIAPDTDMFINEYGERLGPSTANFDEKEMLFYKINKRRYTVLEDRKIKIESPVTLQYQSTFASANHANPHYTPIVTNSNGNCERYLTMYHQLSKAKNGKVFYADPLNATPPSTATTGHRREYVLFLFAYQGADAITGEGAALSQAPTSLIQIDHVNYSKFIDV